MARRRQIWAKFDTEASHWRQEIEDRGDEVGDREELASRWQQYSDTNSAHLSQRAILIARCDHCQGTDGNLWWNGDPPRQANLSLKHGHTSMSMMFSNMQQHPLAIGSNGKSNWMVLDGAWRAWSVADSKVADHYEHTYHVKLTTVLGFNLVVGYGRHKDRHSAAGQSTPSARAWVVFGDHCTEEWQQEYAVNLLLNLVGYEHYYPFFEQPRPDCWQRWQARHQGTDWAAHPQVFQPPAELPTQAATSPRSARKAGIALPVTVSDDTANAPAQPLADLQKKSFKFSCWRSYVQHRLHNKGLQPLAELLEEDEEASEEEEEEEEEESEESYSSTEHWCVCGARLEPDWECVCID